jgi:hypothetical protein
MLDVPLCRVKGCIVSAQRMSPCCTCYEMDGGLEEIRCCTLDSYAWPLGTWPGHLSCDTFL